MQSGTIKFVRSSGWGFISRDSGRDIFFHCSDAACPTSELVRGARVCFVVGQNKYGELAQRVRILDEEDPGTLSSRDSEVAVGE